MRDGHVMKWMKYPLAGFISRWRADGKIHRIACHDCDAGRHQGAGATAFADETVTDGGNVAAESSSEPAGIDTTIRC